MEELEQEIIAWHLKIMPDATLEAVEEKVREEFLEFEESWIITGNLFSNLSRFEFADMFIAYAAGLKKAGKPSLSQTIRDKFAIVQSRDYRPDGTRDKGE